LTLESWLDAVLATPGLTSISDREEAWAMLVEDALRGIDVVRSVEGPIVDVGSGGGSPGIPLAAALPDRQVTLLEANARKAHFLERAAADFPNVPVVRGRAEEQPAEHVSGTDCKVSTVDCRYGIVRQNPHTTRAARRPAEAAT